METYLNTGTERTTDNLYDRRRDPVFVWDLDNTLYRESSFFESFYFEDKVELTFSEQELDLTRKIIKNYTSVILTNSHTFSLIEKLKILNLSHLPLFAPGDISPLLYKPCESTYRYVEWYLNPIQDKEIIWIGDKEKDIPPWAEGIIYTRYSKRFANTPRYHTDKIQDIIDLYDLKV